MVTGINAIGAGAANAVGAGNGVGRAYTPPTSEPKGPDGGFGDALQRGLQAVSNLEHQADGVTQSLATGGPARIEDLMVATTKAQMGIEMLSVVRDRAVEAYQEIMRMPV